MSLYFLNISVDSADPYPEHISENLSINDQESVIEIVIEKILGYEDAIEEYDDNDAGDHTTKTNITIDLINQNIFDSNFELSFLKTTNQKFPDNKTSLLNGFQKLDVPPPEFDLFTI